ncbi:Molybdopterin or thiamine biosynthesis adenylyltransferase [Mameliella alba]|uniref:HesA/MoeB/ThiF family protein n=1 Tax=Mameliella alba TaxID=561184 RepID=UPI0008876084|nr:molybdopterin-synthase adenylyltransferase MoeB [Mameliella alba]OWV44103.1 molybdopterin biosynthesis protein [Mameliella alba]PTR36338.1 molybdopterin/thiamine biosynthesis adenylyltransferase [Mameliella alba]GGF79515.1 molybdopterin biosynthesis protein [Mameliella alba]SDD94720.1 Molybdopterin or thiamine biosynthesis adenylyltransferase [Mameliella alba]
MVFVLALAAVIWGIGHLMKVPKVARFYMLGLLYVVVLMVQVVLPPGHPLREATGSSAALWLILGGFVVLGFAYALGLRRLKARAVEKATADAPVPDPSKFREGELERYARHIVLRELGGPGQKRLKEAKVLVVGAGGLGSPALLYLAAAGVGTIGVIDDDEVDSGNLQRQVIHTDARIGMAKVFSAQAAMEALNPYIAVRPYRRRLDDESAAALLEGYDVVLDGTDNFDTRYLVNRACVAAGKPLISGALSQWEGQVSVFDPTHSGPCYQCIFPEAPAPGLAPSCAVAGVLGPLPGVVGSMMAVECIKLISGAGAVLRGEMLIYDALWSETRKITLKRREDCPVCGGTAG